LHLTECPGRRKLGPEYSSPLQNSQCLRIRPSTLLRGFRYPKPAFEKHSLYQSTFNPTEARPKCTNILTRHQCLDRRPQRCPPSQGTAHFSNASYSTATSGTPSGTWGKSSTTWDDPNRYDHFSDEDLEVRNDDKANVSMTAPNMVSPSRKTERKDTSRRAHQKRQSTCRSNQGALSRIKEAEEE
jgi:hypothetical protein